MVENYKQKIIICMLSKLCIIVLITLSAFVFVLCVSLFGPGADKKEASLWTRATTTTTGNKRLSVYGINAVLSKL